MLALSGLLRSLKKSVSFFQWLRSNRQHSEGAGMHVIRTALAVMFVLFFWGSKPLLFAEAASSEFAVSSANTIAEVEEALPAGMPVWMLYLLAQQQAPYDPDAPCQGSEQNPERLFLQQVGPDSAIIKWRSAGDPFLSPSQICFGTDQTLLPRSSRLYSTTTALGHSEVLLAGLNPDTLYYYSVGGAGEAQSSRSFRTAPSPGSLPSDGNIRLWIVGDSGVGGYVPSRSGSAEVREGLYSWISGDGGEPVDLFLMLGDNAYNNGTDAEHQGAIFDVYPDLLESVALWPAIGNHEMGSGGGSTSTNPGSYSAYTETGLMPYLDIFSLPKGGEIGGVASGTEQYYSFDYGTVHVVSLDSQLAMRNADQRAAMKQWLIDDLTANLGDWTIVIFHHPPYTKGSHDSDSGTGNDLPITLIREQFTPIFEDYGVDLALSGHSHIYERSYYLNGHRDVSATFSAGSHAETLPNGNPANGQGAAAYEQITATGFDDRVVYTVAGNGGKVTSTSSGYPHPAHFYSDLRLGSVVVDADADRLVARFIDVDGIERDYYEISR